MPQFKNYIITPAQYDMLINVALYFKSQQNYVIMILGRIWNIRDCVQQRNIPL